MIRVWGMVAALGLSGCLDGVLETECDRYVDYICSCDPDNCASAESELRGNVGLEPQCRIDLACFEQADSASGTQCSIIATEREDECLPG